MQLTCSICYDDIEETFKIDSCNHIYCRSCITKWAREKVNTCPCCRRKFNILTDANDIIIDYFVDKKNNDWVALNILWDGEWDGEWDGPFRFTFFDGFYDSGIVTMWRIYCWFVTFDEKIPSVPYNRKLNKGSRYMDMGHYQRALKN